MVTGNTDPFKSVLNWMPIRLLKKVSCGYSLGNTNFIIKSKITSYEGAVHSICMKI